MTGTTIRGAHPDARPDAPRADLSRNRAPGPPAIDVGHPVRRRCKVGTSWPITCCQGIRRMARHRPRPNRGPQRRHATLRPVRGRRPESRGAARPAIPRRRRRDRGGGEWNLPEPQREGSAQGLRPRHRCLRQFVRAPARPGALPRGGDPLPPRRTQRRLRRGDLGSGLPRPRRRGRRCLRLSAGAKPGGAWPRRSPPRPWCDSSATAQPGRAVDHAPRRLRVFAPRWSRPSRSSAGGLPTEGHDGQVVEGRGSPRVLQPKASRASPASETPEGAAEGAFGPYGPDRIAAASGPASRPVHRCAAAGDRRVPGRST